MRSVLRFASASFPRWRAVRAARASLLVASLCPLAHAELLVQPAADASSTTARQLAVTLAPGVAIGTASLIGNREAAGTFSGGTSVGLELEQGILFSTGAVADAPGPNDDTVMGTIWDVPTDDEDAQLSQLLGAATVDAAGLTFSFSCPASARSVRVDYIFGSDEYAGFTHPEDLLEVNEGIAILIDGVNAARLSNGMAVTVPHLQLFAPGSFRDNNACHESSGEACPFNVQADGFSGRLIAHTTITPGTGTRQAKIVIADDFFEDIDSWVLLRAFSCSDSIGITNQVPDLGSLGALWLGLGLLGVAGITRLVSCNASYRH